MPELKELLEALADEGQPRGADEVLRRARARVAHRDSTARQTRRHGWLVAAAVIATSLATASSVSLFRQSSDDTSRPTAVGNVGRIGQWEVVPFPRSGFEPGTRVLAIARDGRGLVAVGSIESATGSPAQAAWTSSDGRRWRQSSDATFGAGVIDLVAQSADGLIAIGSAIDGPGPRTVWRSEDGRRWERLTEDAPAGIRSVVSGGPGLVAAGFTSAGETSVVTRAAIWTSVKGKRWSAVPSSKGLFPPGNIAGLALDRSRVIAIGTDQSASSVPAQGRAAVWSSKDGTHWNRIRGHAGLQNATVTGSEPIANREGELRILAIQPRAPTPASPTTTSTPSTGALPGTTLRLCARGSGPNAVWGSARGRHWDRISKVGAAPGASQLIGAGKWWLAGGMRGTCEATRSVVYISSNGRQWTKAKADPKRSPSISYVNAMSSTADGAVVVVGQLEPAAGMESGPDVWLWTAPARQ